MSSGRARWGSPTGRRCWDVTTRREGPWRRRPRRREELWKRRGVEKSERRLSHPAWKSRKVRGIPTFPQLRRRLVKLLHRTYHVLQKADILTCYEHAVLRICDPQKALHSRNNTQQRATAASYQSPQCVGVVC